MANKCLEFCQALASQGQKFSFSLSFGTNFSFSLDTKEKSTSLDNSKMTTLQQGRKKLSPSQVRRNQQRKDDFLKRKFDTSQTVLSEQKKNCFTCNQCEKYFKSENDLEIHMEHTHRANTSFETIEQLDGQTDNSVSFNKSTYKDVLEKPSKLVKEPVMKIINNYFRRMDSENLKNMCAEELNDLTKEISRKVGLEMKLKLMPECDSSNLKSAVSNTLKKHMKAQCEAKTSKT